MDPYRRWAPWYDRTVEPMFRGVRNAALAMLPPQAGWRVLDVGCGTGTALIPYADFGCDIVGVDVSPAMLQQAEQLLGSRAQLHLTQGGPLPFPDDEFDLVLCSMVLHEVAADERPGLLAEMARVVDPKGRIQVTDFRVGSLRGWKGPVFRLVNDLIERVSGHYGGFRSFRGAGGIPPLAASAGLTIEGEKIVSGGNLAIYVLTR